MILAVGRPASDYFRQWRFVVFGLLCFPLALAGEQSVLEIANAFDHCCCLLAKVGHMYACHLAVFADCSCQLAKIASDFICAADDIVGGFFYLATGRQTNPIYRFNGGGAQL